MNRSPVAQITPDDVLCGRGGKTNNHAGNVKYRSIVFNHQQEYLAARRTDKTSIARRIVNIVRENGGRFLKNDCGCWLEVEDKKAIEKTSQALREKLSNRQVVVHKIKSKSAIRKEHGCSSSSAKRGTCGTVEKKQETTSGCQQNLKDPTNSVSLSSNTHITHHNDSTSQQSSTPESDTHTDSPFSALPLEYDVGDTDDCQYKSDPSLIDETELIHNIDLEFFL